MTNGAKDVSLRIGIVGMGPIGSTLAAHLIDAGAYVVPCDIDVEKIDHIRKAGIRLENTIEKEVSVGEACNTVAGFKGRELDAVAVSVKTPALKRVLDDLSGAVSEGTFVLAAQNGLDNEQEVAEAFGQERTLRMSVNWAGNMSSPNTVNVTFFNPPNYVAALDRRGEALASTITRLLNSVDLKTETSSNIRKHTWTKAILNAALSPVCAITRLTMKTVMDSPEGLALATAILEESIQVAEAEGLTFGEDFLPFCIKYLNAAGHHRPSMYWDLESGLLTEIDYLNGRIAEYGRKHGLSTPHNETITGLIHMLEKSSRERA